VGVLKKSIQPNLQLTRLILSKQLALDHSIQQKKRSEIFPNMRHYNRQDSLTLLFRLLPVFSFNKIKKQVMSTAITLNTLI